MLNRSIIRLIIIENSQNRIVSALAKSSVIKMHRIVASGMEDFDLKKTKPYTARAVVYFNICDTCSLTVYV